MASIKDATNGCITPSVTETKFIWSENNVCNMDKRFKAEFEVIKDEDGFFCAADKKQMIFTDGKTKKELEDNIKDAVECCFEVPYTDVDVVINYK